MRSTSLIAALALVSAITGCASAPPVASGAVAGEAPESQAILETVDRFFLALAAGDADALDAIVGDATLTVTIRPGVGAPPRYGDIGEVIDRFRAGGGTKVVEPYWSPTVLQRKDLAVVWAPYEARVDGEILHCGVDSFALSRHADGWKIDSISYTMEPNACDELRPADRSVFRPIFPEGD